MLQRHLIAAVLCFMPFAAFGQHVRQVPSPLVGDYLQSGDIGVGFTVAWVSTAPANKSESLGPNAIACSSAINAAKEFTIKDEIGTAGTYPITVTPASPNTIDGLGSFTLNSNFESITFQCDGISNWLVE